MKLFGKDDKNDEKKSGPVTTGNENLSAEEKANIEKGLNKDGSAKELTEDQKQANLAAGLNEDGSAKEVILTEEQKKAHLAAGLNEDGSPKAADSVTFNTTDKVKEDTATEEYVPSEFVIKEMMHQKNCSREEAIKRLKNPN